MDGGSSGGGETGVHTTLTQMSEERTSFFSFLTGKIDWKKKAGEKKQKRLILGLKKIKIKSKRKDANHSLLIFLSLTLEKTPILPGIYENSDDVFSVYMKRRSLAPII
jgi:hypothetical protein